MPEPDTASIINRPRQRDFRDGLRRLGAPGGTMNSCTVGLHSAAAAVTSATKVVMPVYYAGHPADLDAIDELPQLINVIRGEMPMVGPRPEVPRYVANYDEHERRVLRVRSGITDPASIASRDDWCSGDPPRVAHGSILPADRLGQRLG